uniref:Large ribosomal subunit protein bL33c n=1 Tax=Monotropa hypopitys TaxID=176248 RepID=A0A140G114_9ERIC|nr:ribosomal protein L33 [Monotropa hypopitys]AMM04609.1 ribosomal protein L33 [Monotropa hypopitys]ANP26262.1 ribosomal protein L33 [Monotropa hypopitys]
MTKDKKIRITVTLECNSCIQKDLLNLINKGVSRYITQKNQHKAPQRLELRKFCPYCHKHTIHGEIKK